MLSSMFLWTDWLQVATIESLTHGYNDRPLFKDVTLQIDKGDRVAIIGPNGAGALWIIQVT
jgi:ATPase subunit of ABC transporter with duplicated ATPase domains